MSRTTPRFRADLLLVAVCFVWGSTFVVVKAALNDASTLLFLAARFLLAFLALALLLRRSFAQAFRNRGVLVGGALTGLFMYLAYVLQTMGLRYTSPSKSAFLTGLSIILVPIFAAIFNRKVPGVSEGLGIAVATVGMGLMTLRGDALAMEPGDLMTLGCAVSYAIQILLVGYFVPKYGFQAFTLVQVATAALLSAGSFWWMETPRVRWTPGLLTAIVVTGLFATAFAFSAQAWAQQHTTATRTALILAIEPVFAWLTSFLIVGELLSVRATIGAFLILAGVLLVELKPLRSETPAPAQELEADPPEPCHSGPAR